MIHSACTLDCKWYSQYLFSLNDLSIFEKVLLKVLQKCKETTNASLSNKEKYASRAFSEKTVVLASEDSMVQYHVV